MRVLRFLLGAIAALMALAWTASLISNTGVLVWSWTHYHDAVYNITIEEMQTAGAPTYPPVGKQCSYLTYSGVRDVFFVASDDHIRLTEEVQSGGDIANWIRRATIVPTRDWNVDCSALHNFGTER